MNHLAHNAVVKDKREGYDQVTFKFVLQSIFLMYNPWCCC